MYISTTPTVATLWVLRCLCIYVTESLWYVATKRGALLLYRAAATATVFASLTTCDQSFYSHLNSVTTRNMARYRKYVATGLKQGRVHKPYTYHRQEFEPARVSMYMYTTDILNTILLRRLSTRVPLSVCLFSKGYLPL